MAGSSAAILCVNSSAPPAAPSEKKKRNQPGTPSPDAEVVALSPKTLLATNRFICEVCNQGFQREQNLQLHRRGHNLPWKLKQKASGDVARKKVYLCPEPGCVHHDPARALGDLTGIKKHFSRKHGEKRFTCEKCNKKYAVLSDCKAHSKHCGSKAYKCDCGTTFSRRDNFVSHKAYCEALAQDTARHSLSSIAATMYANASSAAIPTLGSTAPLMMSADHQEPVSHPVFELGAPAAASRPNSFTDLLSAESVGSAFRPIQQLTAPVQPPEPKLNYQFSQFQGFNNNTAPAGPVFNLGSPQYFEDDLKINNNIGLFTSLMMNDDAPVYGTPQLSSSALLQKTAVAGSSSSSADLMKSLGSSSTGGVNFTNYGGVFGDAMSGVGAGGAGTASGGGASYHELYDTINAGVTAGSYGNGGGYGTVGMEIREMNNAYGGIMYNAKSDGGMKLDNQENNNIALEMSVDQRSGHRDKLTRDFLGVGKMRSSFSGGILEDDQKGNGTELKAPDSEATTSARPKLPFVRYRPDV